MSLTESLIVLNGLIVLTSAMLAMANILDKDHRDSINELKAMIRNLDFSCAPQNHALEALQETWESVLNDRCVRLVRHIILLSFLLSFAFAPISLMLLLSVPTEVIRWTLIICFSLLIGCAIWGTFSIVKMRTEKQKYKHDVEHVQKMHPAILSTMKSIGAASGKC